MSDTQLREHGHVLMPRYDSAGLITAVVTDRASGQVLMLAHANAAAIELTMQTGFAHFWSRSRQALWKKGETSGHVLRVVELRVDCDQDALQMIVDPVGPACHTLAQSCFYRRITPDGALERVDEG
jgi:phosphoribosyl-AMP cyclohydrolase